LFGLSAVDVGDGWLIFGLPPAEVAVHPSSQNNVHEFYFMCDEIEAFVAEMAGRAINCEPVQNAGSGPAYTRDIAGRWQAGSLSAAPRAPESNDRGEEKPKNSSAKSPQEDTEVVIPVEAPASQPASRVQPLLTTDLELGQPVVEAVHDNLSNVHDNFDLHLIVGSSHQSERSTGVCDAKRN
jgi:hypothetical protein